MEQAKGSYRESKEIKAIFQIKRLRLQYGIAKTAFYN